MGTTAARTYGAATLAVGTVASVCLMTAPAASAADTTGTDTDTPVVAANVGGGLRDALDRARGLFTFNDGDVAGAVADAQNTAQKLREQAVSALRDADVATKLGLANDNVVALTDFVNELNAHAETLNSVLVSMPDAPKDADTLDTVTLTMTTRDGQVGVKTLNNVPRDAAETLRTALEGAVDSVRVDTVTPTTTTAPTPKATTSKATPTTSAPKAAPTTSKATAPAATTTQRDGDKAGTDADLNASIDELRRIAAAIEAAKANNPQVIEEMLTRLADPSRGAGHADINTVTGKNVNTVQNVNANTGSTSVAINVNPDGGLSISAAQGTDGAGGTAQPGKDTSKDADAVIAALDNLAAALRGEKASKTDNTGSTSTTDTAAAAPTSTMSADEAAQHDRLRRALLALTSPEREANSPASRERDALIMIAQALKDGKDINLEELTTEQMLQVMDWLQNGIPEQALPDATATATTATSTATEPTATAATSTTTESSTVTTQPSAVTVTETASPTTTTTTKKKKKDKDSDEADETDEASKELASAINGLAKGLAERHSTTAATTTTPSSKNKDADDAKRDNDERRVPVSTTSTTRVPADKQNNAGGGSGSGSNTGGSGSNKGTSGQSNGSAAQSNTGGNAAAETAAAAPAAENADVEPMQAEAVSEKLAVTGNSTQRMLMLLTLLGSVAAAALFIAMRRTRAE